MIPTVRKVAGSLLNSEFTKRCSAHWTSPLHIFEGRIESLASYGQHPEQCLIGKRYRHLAVQVPFRCPGQAIPFGRVANEPELNACCGPRFGKRCEKSNGRFYQKQDYLRPSNCPIRLSDSNCIVFTQCLGYRVAFTPCSLVHWYTSVHGQQGKDINRPKTSSIELWA